MNIDNKIYVAGHSGMVGSSIVHQLQKGGFSNLILKTHDELDITNQSDVKKFYQIHKPDYVFICAAKVGGIKANNTYRAQFIYENIQIQNNLIHYAHTSEVKKLLFLGSSCIYPRDCPQPMKEEYLLTGRLEETNEPYAIAKIAGIKMCENYHKQYGNNFISVMPTNLYGPNDNFNLETSHVLPALMRKFHEAKIQKKQSVEVWGTGKPKREFLYVSDMAKACLFLMENLNAYKLYSKGISHLNIGSGKEISIAELSNLISSVVNYEGDIKYNSKKPDGAKQKLLDISRLSTMGWRPKIKLKTGIEKTYHWFIDNYAK
jgi:GDP-L-fucose synthase